MNTNLLRLTRGTCLLLALLLLALLLCGCSPIEHDARDNQTRIMQSLNLALASQPPAPKHLLNKSLRHQLTPKGDSDYLSQTHMNISAHQLGIHPFFLNLVDGTDYGIALSPKLSGTVDVALKDVTLQQVLDYMQQAYHLQYTRQGHNLIIAPRAMRTAIFSIDHLNIKRSGSSFTQISGGSNSSSGNTSNESRGNANNGSQSGNAGSNSSQGGSTGSSSISTTSEDSFWDNLQSSIQMILRRQPGDTKKSSVKINRQAGTVVVTAYPAEISEVKRLIYVTQRLAQRQVLIEAKVLEVELNKAYSYGIDWSLFGAHSTPMGGTSGSGEGNLYKVKVSGGSFHAMIRMLSTQGRVSLISSPRISVLNNEQAIIKVGSDQYFVTNVSTVATPVGNTNELNSNINLEPFFSGISLDVTPQINAQHEITMHIHPALSRVTKDTKTIELDGKINSLPVAESAVREADSIVRAKSGDVIVIGGLSQSISHLKRSFLPLTHNKTHHRGLLNALNRVFNSQEDTASHTEIIILLRPVITGQKSWVADLMHSKDRFRALWSSQQ